MTPWAEEYERKLAACRALTPGAALRANCHLFPLVDGKYTEIAEGTFGELVAVVPGHGGALLSIRFPAVTKSVVAISSENVDIVGFPATIQGGGPR